VHAGEGPRCVAVTPNSAAVDETSQAGKDICETGVQTGVDYPAFLALAGRWPAAILVTILITFLVRS